MASYRRASALAKEAFFAGYDAGQLDAVADQDAEEETLYRAVFHGQTEATS